MEELKNKAIGVMDSGVGGLTVLKELQKICPNENYIYFGDTKNLPYGEKSKEELITIVKEIFDFFETQKVKAVILACNTSSAVAYDKYKDKYSFTIYPLIQEISKYLSQDKSIKRIGVMATQATVNSQKYTQSLTKNNPDIQVLEQACPLLVPIVENKVPHIDKNTVIKEYLSPILEFKPQKIILGCTHYPYLLDDMAQFAKKDIFINPAEIFAQTIKADLSNKSLLTDRNIGKTKYLASSNPSDFEQNAKLFLELEKAPELIKL